MTFVPLAFFALSTIASVTYKLLNSHKLDPAKRRAIITAHAFVIEAIQIALLVTWVVITVFIIVGASPQLRLIAASATMSPSLAIFTTTTTYALVIWATDNMDNLIQLHTWHHPIQSQTLILSRSILLPRTVLRKANGPRKTTIVRRRRAMSAPATPTVAHIVSRHPPRRTSTIEPGSVAKLVSTFEEVLSCTVALSRLEEWTPSAIYELEGCSVGGDTDEATITPESTLESATTVLKDESKYGEALHNSPSVKHKIELAPHKKAARPTEARVEARRLKAQCSSR